MKIICNTTGVDVHHPFDKLDTKEERIFDYTLNTKRANAKIFKGGSERKLAS